MILKNAFQTTECNYNVLGQVAIYRDNRLYVERSNKLSPCKKLELKGMFTFPNNIAIQLSRFLAIKINATKLNKNQFSPQMTCIIEPTKSILKKIKIHECLINYYLASRHLKRYFTANWIWARLLAQQCITYLLSIGTNFTDMAMRKPSLGFLAKLAPCNIAATVSLYCEYIQHSSRTTDFWLFVSNLRKSKQTEG